MHQMQIAMYINAINHDQFDVDEQPHALIYSDHDKWFNRWLQDSFAFSVMLAPVCMHGTRLFPWNIIMRPVHRAKMIS